MNNNLYSALDESMCVKTWLLHNSPYEPHYWPISEINKARVVCGQEPYPPGYGSKYSTGIGGLDEARQGT